MAAEEDAFEEIEGEEQYVPVVFARDGDEAEEYRQLLEDHDIPVIAGHEDEDEEDPSPASQSLSGRGVPILVPEPLLDEASEIIADMEGTDEFVLAEEDLDDDEDEEEEFGLVEEMGSDLDDDLEEDDLFDEDVEEDEEP